MPLSEKEELELLELEKEKSTGQGSGASIGPENPAATEYLEPASALQEMPPEVSAAERSFLKNFGSDPNAMVKYLQERHPDYKVTHFDKNIYFEKPGEHRRVLDPDTGIWDAGIKENLKDLADIPVDVAQGVASKTAGAAGGLAGGAATLPSGGWGALPAAMAASGGTNATIEALKQYIGKLGGIPQDVNGGDVAISGAAGAVDPLFFGTGAGASQAEKYALPADQIKKLIASQRGIPSQLASKFGSLISGIPSKTIETAAEKLPVIKNLETQSSPAGTLAEMVSDDVAKIEKHRGEIGKAIGAAHKSAGGPIPLGAAQAPYLKKIEELEAIDASEGLSPALKTDLENLKSEYMDLFGATPKSSPAFTSPEAAFLLKKKLGDAGDIQRQASNSRDFSQKVLQGAAKRSAGILGDTLEESRPALKTLNPEYDAVNRLLEQIGGNKTNTKEKAYNLIKSLSKPNKEVLAEDLMSADKNVGTKFMDTSNLVDAFNTFRRNRVLPLAKREIASRAPLAVAGGVAGYNAGASSGNRGSGLAGAALGTAGGAAFGSPTAMRFYLEALTNKFSPVGPVIRDAAGRVVLPTWNMMNSRREQNQEDGK